MPIGALYLETATNIVIALDRKVGQRALALRSAHRPRAPRIREATSRGVSLWEDSGLRQAAVACRRRVFTGTLDARLLALDADTGRLCEGFGHGGQVDLTQGIRIRDVGGLSRHLPACDLRQPRDRRLGASATTAPSSVERGVIRAFDARSGALVWAFDPIPDSPSHPAAGEWDRAQAQKAGAGNAWGVMTVDEEHGLVLIPTGSASPDFYGGLRVGSNRFADSLLVLEAGTGKLAWQQQLVHHDLWDYDVAAQPVLGDVEIGGAPVPAVIQATKTGMLYVFERTQRPAALSHQRKSRAAEPRARRAGLAHTAVLRVACAGLAGAGTAGRRLGTHLLGPRQVPRPHPLAAQRGHLHPAGCARHAAHARLHRRGRTGAASRSMNSTSASSPR